VLFLFLSRESVQDGRTDGQTHNAAYWDGRTMLPTTTGRVCDVVCLIQRTTGRGYVWWAQAVVMLKAGLKSTTAACGAPSAMTALTTSLLKSSVTTSALGLCNCDIFRPESKNKAHVYVFVRY